MTASSGFRPPDWWTRRWATCSREASRSPSGPATSSTRTRRGSTRTTASASSSTPSPRRSATTGASCIPGWRSRWGGDRRGRSLRGQNLLEEPERPRVIRLPQPEQRLPPDGGVPVGPRDPDEDRHALVMAELGEREHCLLPHVAVLLLVLREVGETPGGGVAGVLAQPEDRVLPDRFRNPVILGQRQQIGPHLRAVGDRRGEDGAVRPSLPARAPPPSPGWAPPPPPRAHSPPT